MSQRMTQAELDALWAIYDREFTYSALLGASLFIGGMILVLVGLLLTFHPKAYGIALFVTVVGFTAVVWSTHLPTYKAR